MLIRLEALSKSFGGRTLFDNLQWQINPGQRIGLVGPNGVGKSTLIKLMTGEGEPDGGRVLLPRGVDIGYLPQELTVETDAPLISFILEGADRLRAMERQLAELQAQLEGATGEHAQRLTEAYAELQERFARQGGYTIESQAREIASGMGFSREQFDSSLQSFSGGWRMRALLCRLLLRHPDLLLLDEPTNHLDLESIAWLEGFLRNYEGSLVVISHDRYFMNRVISQIAELLPDQIRVYTGDYDRFLVQREQERERLIKAADQQQREIARIESFVDRFRYKATKSNQVQSRIKQLDRIDRIDVDAIQGPALDFRFVTPERMGRLILQAHGITKAFGEHVIYRDADFTLERGDKVGFVGPNGAGKTTLLKMLAGTMPPDRGHIELGHNVTLSYFAQHSVDQLDLEATVLDEMHRHATPASAPRVRNILGAFGFSGDSVEKVIRVLSGGEKTRLALAKLLLRPAGVLLLDEPTNHLDIGSREVLEEALRAFEGAVCVISHDRYFLNQVVNRVVHIQDRVVTDYRGDYEYYLWKSAQDAAAQAALQPSDASRDDEGGASRKDVRRLSAQLRQQRLNETRALRARVDKLEGDVSRAEAERSSAEAKLSDPELYAKHPEQVGELNRALKQLDERLDALMVAWAEAQEQLEVIEQRYQDEEDRLRQG